MIFVVQLFRRAACVDVAAVEHHQHQEKNGKLKYIAFCHGTCQLGIDPWCCLECGRKEGGVTLSRRMECGVTPSRRRISLKGAVAHFFPFFFLPHATTCFLVSLNKEPYLFLHNPPVLPYPLRTVPSATVLVLSLLRAVSSPLSLSCPCCVPSARHRPCPALAARRPCPVLIARRPIATRNPCPVLVAHRPLSARRPCPVHCREPNLTLPRYTLLRHQYLSQQSDFLTPRKMSHSNETPAPPVYREISANL